MHARRSWAWIRAAVLLIGIPFVAGSLVGACLDYAGEELFQGCDTTDAGATGQSASSGATTGSGSGSGSGSRSSTTTESPADEQADCGTPAAPTGSGSGSGS